MSGPGLATGTHTLRTTNAQVQDLGDPVEVAGIEPASASVNPGLLRAQPATAFLGPDDRTGTSSSWAQSLFMSPLGPVTGPATSGLLVDASIQAEGEPGLTARHTRSGGESDGLLRKVLIGSYSFATRINEITSPTRPASPGSTSNVEASHPLCTCAGESTRSLSPLVPHSPDQPRPRPSCSRPDSVPGPAAIDKLTISGWRANSSPARTRDDPVVPSRHAACHTLSCPEQRQSPPSRAHRGNTARAVPGSCPSHA